MAASHRSGCNAQETGSCVGMAEQSAETIGLAEPPAWLALGWLEQRPDRIAVTQGIVQPLEQEDHGCIPWRLPVGLKDRSGCGAVHRFATKVHGGDHRSVELSLLQCRNREIEGNQAGQLFG